MSIATALVRSRQSVCPWCCSSQAVVSSLWHTQHCPHGTSSTPSQKSTKKTAVQLPSSKGCDQQKHCCASHVSATAVGDQNRSPMQKQCREGFSTQWLGHLATGSVNLATIGSSSCCSLIQAQTLCTNLAVQHKTM